VRADALPIMVFDTESFDFDVAPRAETCTIRESHETSHAHPLCAIVFRAVARFMWLFDSTHPLYRWLHEQPRSLRLGSHFASSAAAMRWRCPSLRRRMSTVRGREMGLLAALPFLASACVPKFVQPEVTQPHALVKVRIAYHVQSGPYLAQSVKIGEFAAPVEPPAGNVTTPYIRAVRVPPEPTTWQVESQFFHLVTETERVPVQVSESYSCGTDTSHSGSGSSARSTTQTKTCTRTRTEYRMQTQTRQVVDALCKASVTHAPQAAEAYLLQYDFYGSDQCTLRCYRQAPTGAGKFALTPCENH
jgi:hypothetical protein